MATEKTRDCDHCEATNPADYSFCFHCRREPGDVEEAAAAEPKKASKKSAAKKRRK